MTDDRDNKLPAVHRDKSALKTMLDAETVPTWHPEPDLRPKDILALRVAQSETPEEAQQWQDVLVRHQLSEREETEHNFGIALAVLRFIVLVGIGSALIGIFDQVQLGFFIIGTQVLPKESMQRFLTAYLEATNDN